MALRMNGITGTYPTPSLAKQYSYSRLDPILTIGLSTDAGTVQKTIDVKTLLEKAWQSVMRKSENKMCNNYFKTLFRKKTLKEVLNEGDITLHMLEPKPGRDWSVVPYANASGRDIGLNPELFVDEDADVVACTLVHELAHVAGASTNAGAPQAEAHAAELALMSCSCQRQYDKDIVGRNLTIGTPGGQRYV